MPRSSARDGAGKQKLMGVSLLESSLWTGLVWTRFCGCDGSHLIIRVSHLHVADNSMCSLQGYLMFWVSGAVLGVSIFLAHLL